MNGVLRELVARGGGVVTRTAVQQVVPRWVLQRASGTGDLVRVLPGVFVAAHLLADRPSGFRRSTASTRSWPAGRCARGRGAGPRSVTSLRSTCGVYAARRTASRCT
ncbi:hypothetical protein O7605_22405 [Verrucosispora sp. WMMA2121]|uniref:hypothetical protein n=1 Tax=Verrucosispora sp. WMMA2121 TaxID=3015164 RepID=UPI0022B63CF0|nr:hypothetical protein [Verrucosispora sp. WMMA2121]MCZ7422251.1 hypothetical protein [Verrucosispora sp. WMMA2121]